MLREGNNELCLPQSRGEGAAASSPPGRGALVRWEDRAALCGPSVECSLETCSSDEKLELAVQLRRSVAEFAVISAPEGGLICARPQGTQTGLRNSVLQMETDTSGLSEHAAATHQGLS